MLSRRNQKTVWTRGRDPVGTRDKSLVVKVDTRSEIIFHLKGRLENQISSQRLGRASDALLNNLFLSSEQVLYFCCRFLLMGIS